LANWAGGDVACDDFGGDGGRVRRHGGRRVRDNWERGRRLSCSRRRDGHNRDRGVGGYRDRRGGLRCGWGAGSRRSRGGHTGDGSWVLREVGRANTLEVGVGSVGLVLVGTPSTEAVNDLAGQVSVLTVARNIGVVLAARFEHPGVQALGNDRRAGSGWNGGRWDRSAGGNNDCGRGRNARGGWPGRRAAGNSWVRRRAGRNGR